MSDNTPCAGPRASAEANVTISLKGLAIGSYNENNERWEVVFLCEVPGHNLRITVNKCLGGALLSSDSYDIGTGEKIHVRSDKARPQKPRYESGDDMDINHIVDFSSSAMYQGSVDFKLPMDIPVTFLSIADSVFYTKALTRNTYNILKDNVVIEYSQSVAMTVGADIICEAGGKTEIHVESDPNLIPALPAEDGLVYEIIFDNICSGTTENIGNDFDLYCDCFAMPQKFTLALAELRDMGEKKPPCNSVLVSELGNIKSLEQLLDG